MATPFNVHVYIRGAMVMAASETALEGLMCRVLGDLVQEGYVAKLADDLYCGANKLQDITVKWQLVLEALQRNNLRLSPSKTVIFPKSTSILLLKSFKYAQSALSNHRPIVIPRPADKLWKVTDGSVSQRDIGSTLFVTRGKQLSSIIGRFLPAQNFGNTMAPM